jgi:hypothetical protein
MRLSILAAAAALLAGPALAQTGTTAPAAPQTNQQSLSELDKACREQGPQSSACQNFNRMRAGTTGGATTGSTATVPPATGTGTPARPTAPAAPTAPSR